VSARWALPEERSQDELKAARALLEAGLHDQAVARAYVAGVNAAGAALLTLGEAPSSEVDVISTFMGHVADADLDPGAGRLLRRLYEDRVDVDYALASASKEDAERAVRDAQRLLEVTTSWTELRAAGA
jgi:uncharacterized protein (UPF0332 family)